MPPPGRNAHGSFTIIMSEEWLSIANLLLSSNCTCAGFLPEQNPNRVLDEIHEHKFNPIRLQTPSFIVIYPISPNSNRVAHPISGILAETLHVYAWQ